MTSTLLENEKALPNKKHHSSSISSKHQPNKSGEFKLAVQHNIMLVHIQMQQMVHELAPPICVLKF